MTRLILDQDKAQAVKELVSFIEYQAIACFARGWAYRPSSSAPESFKDLKAWTNNKVIPIADYGCDQSIYGSAEVNIKFRFWHDVTHLELGQGFSPKGERAVVVQHLKDAKSYGLSALATEILNADTLGQVEYYIKHGEFVNNGVAFVDSCLQHGIKTACTVKH